VSAVIWTDKWTVFEHNDIKWSIEVLTFDNGDFEGFTGHTPVSQELVEEMGPERLVAAWKDAVEAHVLSHEPAKWGWRRLPQLDEDKDFEYEVSTWRLTCRVFWSKRTAETPEEIGVVNAESNYV